MAKLALSQNREADELLSRSPLALVIGMVLDQQITLEKAFLAPYLLKERLSGRLDAGHIASMDTAVLEKIFSEKPALHRFPASMARRVQEVCTIIARDYANDPTRIWIEATDGEDLKNRVQSLPGFGEMKAKIFIAFLGKQLGLTVPGWREVSVPFGEPDSTISIADIVDEKSLQKVREFKADMKARINSSK